MWRRRSRSAGSEGSRRGGTRALTVLSAGSGAEQQQERGPAEQLHGFAARRGRGKASEERAGESERCVRGGTRCEPPDRSGRWWCAAPCRLRLHLGRAGGGGTASRTARAVKPPPPLPPPAPRRNWREQGGPDLTYLPFPGPNIASSGGPAGKRAGMGGGSALRRGRC